MLAVVLKMVLNITFCREYKIIDIFRQFEFSSLQCLDIDKTGTLRIFSKGMF